MLSLKNMKVPEKENPQDAPEGYVANATKEWSGGNCVTAVKNQGNCGSCYSFSSTETAESSYCINHGTLYTMAEQ